MLERLTKELRDPAEGPNASLREGSRRCSGSSLQPRCNLAGNLKLCKSWGAAVRQTPPYLGRLPPSQTPQLGGSPPRHPALLWGLRAPQTSQPTLMQLLNLIGSHSAATFSLMGSRGSFQEAPRRNSVNNLSRSPEHRLQARWLQPPLGSSGCVSKQSPWADEA